MRHFSDHTVSNSHYLAINSEWPFHLGYVLSLRKCLCLLAFRGVWLLVWYLAIPKYPESHTHLTDGAQAKSDSWNRLKAVVRIRREPLSTTTCAYSVCFFFCRNSGAFAYFGVLNFHFHRVNQHPLNIRSVPLPFLTLGKRKLATSSSQCVVRIALDSDTPKLPATWKNAQYSRQ